MILSIENMSVARSGKLIIKDINLQIHKGEFVGLVGPNGSGKSTLLLSILGILKTQSGSVKMIGHPPMTKNLHVNIWWV